MTYLQRAWSRVWPMDTIRVVVFGFVMVSILWSVAVFMWPESVGFAIRHYRGQVDLGGIPAIASIEVRESGLEGGDVNIVATARDARGRVIRSVVQNEALTLCTAVGEQLACIRYPDAHWQTKPYCWVQPNPLESRGVAFHRECWEVPSINTHIVDAIINAVVNPEHLVTGSHPNGNRRK